MERSPLPKENQIDLVFVAPDDPLAAGMVDRFEAAGIPAFGPECRGSTDREQQGLFEKFDEEIPHSHCTV